MANHMPAGEAGRGLGFGSFRASELPRSSAPSAAASMGLTYLIDALSRLYPGMRIVDRELELAPSRVAQLVTVDGMGELVLVLAATEDDESSLLTAMDAIAALETDRALIAAHCGATDCNLRLPGRVVVISERFSERFLQRTRAAQDDSLDLLEVRVMHSAAGRRVHLVPPAALQNQSERKQAATPREFIEGLRRDQRPLVQDFLERAQRIDEGLTQDLRDGALRLRFKDRTLAELGHARGVLTARSGQHAASAAPAVLATAGDFESLLERVTEAYVESWGPAETNGHGAESSKAPSAKSARQGVAQPSADPSGGEDLDEFESATKERLASAFDPASPILTREEMEAFGRPM